MSAAPPRIEVHLGPEDLRAALRDDVSSGLGSRPRELPPKWFYDERGCELFDRITRLPEYYPTRAEREILASRAGEVAALSGADTLVELGSGTSEKTRLLLDAMSVTGQLRRIVIFDVSEPTIRQAAAGLAAEYPRAEVCGVVGDFDHHLDLLPTGGRRLVAFLGSTIGNLGPLDRKRFLSDLAGQLEPGDGLLLGTDLVKSPDRLRAAYDDSQGVTAEFNSNVLAVVNRELGADFNVSAFAHCARWDAEAEWMQMSLQSRVAQVARVGELDLDIDLGTGEHILTEISAKFRPEGVRSELAGARLALARWWTDVSGDFGLSLSLAE